MNGIHDMGGMHGMGPIQYEKNEPVFHKPWEGRAFALFMATGDLVPADVSARFAIEQIPAAEYLRMSYYERWIAALERLLVHAGVVTQDEVTKGKPAPGSPKAKPALTAAMVPKWLNETSPSSQNSQVRPLFHVGQRVRSRNMHPKGHTRLPRYARGKVGTVVRDHGVYPLEDTNASSRQTNKPEHVYSVRFAARELWGDAASPRDAVYIDMWDDYLEPA